MIHIQLLRPNLPLLLLIRPQPFQPLGIIRVDPPSLILIDLDRAPAAEAASTFHGVVASSGRPGSFGCAVCRGWLMVVIMMILVLLVWRAGFGAFHGLVARSGVCEEAHAQEEFED